MYYFFLLIVASIISSFLSGLFGMGGGLVMIPILCKAFHIMGTDETICMQIATGTSLGVVAPTSILALREHWKHGAVDVSILKDWMIVLPLTTAIASMLIFQVKIDLTRTVFAVFCFMMGCLIPLRNRLRFKGDFPTSLLRYFWGIFIGMLSGIMGLGGGIFSNVLMLLYGRPINQAAAISTGVGALIAFPGLLTHIYVGWGQENLPPMSLGFVNWGALLCLLPMSFMIAPMAARLSYKIKKIYLEAGFSVVMFLTSFSLFFKL
ncbi:sulfite exporter TauE/SafE family protein [Candidatus Liberibacter sp.]|uniref:sulfite exporter TauE/SafE family protein n=1 Tax=Candidatus Liberibacter sp. TaxID=34022 RepID=UPI0015F5E73B|nr:sulfite exporter TauE/SafE family protein [Candidatus Liberibacter sp.]MBA5724386.1 sulfite exporter TauE/SafE family protein [Candidatus Liberibacter sp.]